VGERLGHRRSAYEPTNVSSTTDAVVEVTFVASADDPDPPHAVVALAREADSHPGAASRVPAAALGQPGDHGRGPLGSYALRAAGDQVPTPHHAHAHAARPH
jgi:hypothetical protein